MRKTYSVQAQTYPDSYISWSYSFYWKLRGHKNNNSALFNHQLELDLVRYVDEVVNEI